MAVYRPKYREPRTGCLFALPSLRNSALRASTVQASRENTPSQDGKRLLTLAENTTT
jgi:hypothetical protein